MSPFKEGDCGFRPVERLEGAPEIQRPQRYLPDACRMISIALHINEAACDLIASNTRRNTVPPSYHSFQLSRISAPNSWKIGSIERIRFRLIFRTS
ncbi:MAG: hypothetical protein ACYTE8_08830 [Planctomycetota bacterium]